MNSSDFQPSINLTPEATSDNEGKIQYLLVALDGREYGVRMNTLQEVLRYQAASVAPVPNTPLWLEGIFSLRGQIISVVNFRVFLGLPAEKKILGGIAEQAEAVLFGVGAVVPRLIVLHDGALLVGLVVDDIRGVLFVKPEEIRPVKTAERVGQYLEGAFTDTQSGKTTWLFDSAGLLNSPEMLVFEPVGF